MEEEKSFEEEKYDEDESDTVDDEVKKQKVKNFRLLVGVIIVILLLLLVYFIIAGMGSDNRISTEQNITLTTGDKYALKNSDKKYGWTSSNREVAIVTNDGEIEALSEGDAVITLTNEDEIITIKIHVDSIDESVNLTSVKMATDSVNLEVDESYTMEVIITPSNATNTELTWYTSNESVAIVKNGKITAVGPGTCMITVKSSNGNTDTCVVKVTETVDIPEKVVVENISFDTENLVLKNGIVYTLAYEVVPPNGDSYLIWESSDESVAKVERGVIETVGEGTATIVAKSGEVESILYLTVVKGDQDTPDIIDESKNVPATSITLNQTEISLSVGGKYTLLSTIIPDNTTDKTVTWNSTDESIVKVDNYGNVTAVGVGVAEVEVYTSNGIKEKCKVIVSAETVEGQEHQKISLNLNSVTLNISDRVQLTETVTPTNSVSQVIWESSNDNIATVTNGLVTAVSSGTATITAKLPNGESATCVVSVSEKVIKVLRISLNATKVDLKIFGSTQLTATVYPTTATNKTITWSSSDSSIASVDSNGKVIGKRAGTVEITAKSANGMIAKCTVVVTSNSTIRAASITNNLANDTVINLDRKSSFLYRK